MLQNFDFDANGRTVNAQGNHFRYESATLSTLQGITVRANGQSLGRILPGDSIELPHAVQTWEIISEGTSGQVRIGTGKVTTARVAGAVKVTAASNDALIAGATFGGSMSTGVPAAVQNAAIQVWNGTSQGLQFNALTLSGFTIAATLNIGVSSSLMATWASITAVSTFAFGSKKASASGPVPVASVSGKATATCTAAGVAAIQNWRGAFQTLQVSAGDRIVLPAPYLIGPGAGLVIVADTWQAPFRLDFDAELTGWSP